MTRKILMMIFAALFVAMPATAQMNVSLDAKAETIANRDVGIERGASIGAHPFTSYKLEAFDPSGRLVWTRYVPHNMLTTPGANTYLNSTIMNGVPVSAESEGSTGGTSTSVTLTLKADTNSQTSTIIPGSLTSLAITGYSGTFSDNSKGGITCTGTCTNFTSSTSSINYATGLITLSFTSGGPNANAATATYAYIPAKYYVSLLYRSSTGSCGAFATGDTLGSNSWSPCAEVTGTQVTNASRPQFVGGTVSSGSVSNSGSVAVFTGNASVFLEGIVFVTSSTLDETSSLLLGEATFTEAPIASGYTINVTVTDNVNAG